MRWLNLEIDTQGSTAPLDIVNQRMMAHNKHNLNTFLGTYSEDIQIYDYPRIPLGKRGKDHIKSIFEPLFADGAVTTDIHYQIVQGNYVINHETVLRRGEAYNYVSIYEVRDGLIQSVCFIKE